MKYKMIIGDVDGTLPGENHQYSEENKKSNKGITRGNRHEALKKIAGMTASGYNDSCVAAVIKKIIGLTATVSLILMLNGCMGLKDFKAEMENLKINDVEFASVADGAYTGSYETKLVGAEVLVKAGSGRITQIDIIKHNHGKGKAAEAITGTVVKWQTLMVDTVSGATYSSKVILKAIENALTGRQQ